MRRQNELLAIGYVAARIIECVFIAGGIILVLGVVSLRKLGANHRGVPGRPRVRVGIVPRDLRGGLGIPEGGGIYTHTGQTSADEIWGVQTTIRY